MEEHFLNTLNQLGICFVFFCAGDNSVRPGAQPWIISSWVSSSFKYLTNINELFRTLLQEKESLLVWKQDMEK